jgi:hypothetical protein
MTLSSRTFGYRHVFIGLALLASAFSGADGA